jgi:hypothetical protein
MCRHFVPDVPTKTFLMCRHFVPDVPKPHSIRYPNPESYENLLRGWILNGLSRFGAGVSAHQERGL